MINFKDLAAHIITEPIDACDYKTYIFPILFFKRIGDVYDEEMEEAIEQVGDSELATAGIVIIHSNLAISLA